MNGENKYKNINERGEWQNGDCCTRVRASKLGQNQIHSPIYLNRLIKSTFAVVIAFNILLLFSSNIFAAEKGIRVSSKNNQVQTTNFYEKSWAVVIGINNYPEWPTLQYAVKDAVAVKKRLESLGFDKVILLTDKMATRKNILQALGEDLAKRVKENDRVVIYFSGHGQTESLPSGGEVGYLIPVDCGKSSCFSEGISMVQLRSIQTRLKAKHILYVVDACYSGIGLSKAGGIDPSIEGFYGKVTKKRSVQMITAGGRDELAQESNGHGVLTNFFLIGLDGEADNDFDGIITGSELGAYVRRRVSFKTKNKQTPQWGALDGEGDIVFVLDKKKASKIFLSIEEEDALIERRQTIQTKENELMAREKQLDVVIGQRELKIKREAAEVKELEKGIFLTENQEILGDLQTSVQEANFHWEGVFESSKEIQVKGHKLEVGTMQENGMYGDGCVRVWIAKVKEKKGLWKGLVNGFFGSGEPLIYHSGALDHLGWYHDKFCIYDNEFKLKFKLFREEKYSRIKVKMIIDELSKSPVGEGSFEELTGSEYVGKKK